MESLIVVIRDLFCGGSWKRRAVVWGIVAFFLLFIWPTPYWYAHVGSTFYRINRFTGAKKAIIDNAPRPANTYLRL